jgi:hypothetical protein
MKHSIEILILLTTVFLAFAAKSDDDTKIILFGKTSSNITATVASKDNFVVTDDSGGWFSNGLAMQQTGARNSPYEVAAGLRVTASSGAFQVRMDQPLQISNQANNNQVFQSPVVTLAADGGAPTPLVVAQSKLFTNPAPGSPNADSVGHYTLKVSALPPEGAGGSTTGIYSGVLSLTFEPVVKQP